MQFILILHHIKFFLVVWSFFALLHSMWDLTSPTTRLMRLDTNYKKKTVRSTNTGRLNNTFLNNQQVTEEIKREIKKFLETNDNENTTTQYINKH